MIFTKILLLLSVTLIFISCGENTTEAVTSDINKLTIDPSDNNYQVHSTSKLELQATITYDDGTYADATHSVSWKLDSDDYNTANLLSNSVYPIANSGSVSVSAIYRNLADFNSSVDVSIIPLTNFYIVPIDSNTTGEHILKAKGNFDDGVNDKEIIYNIVWSSSQEDDDIYIENNVVTIDLDGTGDRTITASIFSGEDDESNQTITYLIK